MPSLDTIKKRASRFAKTFAGITREKQHDQDFMRAFYEVFGGNPYRIAWQYAFKINGQTHWIDGLIPGFISFEIKSKDEDLAKAYEQASRYVANLPEKALPRYLFISDFANLHLYDRGSKNPAEPFTCALAELPHHIEAFHFLAGYEKIALEKQEEANKRAAEQLGELHDAMKANGYTGKDLETYLVRLLFCLFADDTGLFGEKNRFCDYLINHSASDGRDLHGVLDDLFDTLNKNQPSRAKNLPTALQDFPYINGALFADKLPKCYFDEVSRQQLVDCARLDWSEISPDIFGNLFQHIIHYDGEGATPTHQKTALAKGKKRREFGAHYTSERNIRKVIDSLFLDDLKDELTACGNDKRKLSAFHQKLAHLNFFDPACGCGNFLVIAYREIRLLEIEILRRQETKNKIKTTSRNTRDQVIQEKLNTKNPILDISKLILCDVDQFHGIEIDESAVHIATLALWLTDHQMNMRLTELGAYFTRLPLKKKANIVHGNALRLDWREVIAPEKCSFILGNPPFIGKQYQTAEQKEDLALITANINGAGVLDYVGGWYIKAADYINANPSIPVAFVSTNSITQGEQVAVLWKPLIAQGINIHFAHRTFRWSNEGSGVAAVHCVIVGFGKPNRANKKLFDYGDINGEPTLIPATNINPYLVDAPVLILENRKKPLSNVPPIVFGNMPNDGGNLLLSEEDKKELISKEPLAEKWIRPFLGAEEFINNGKRWCLWLVDCPPNELRKMPEVLIRVQNVKKLRENSTRNSTRELANTPSLFGEIRHPNGNYLLIPRVSSEKRLFIPVGFFTAKTIASDACLIIPNATLYHFGILTSTMHNAWMRAVCGRLKSDYRYSNTIVYNNFPWPENISDKHKTTIETAAQAVLTAREQFPTSSLADLYDPRTTPPALARAHTTLDRAVDTAYRKAPFPNEPARVQFLFERYQALITLIVK